MKQQLKSTFFLLGIFAKATVFAINLNSHLLKEETTIATYFRHDTSTHNNSKLKNIACIYVMNLEKHPEKWADTDRKLKHYNLGYNRFIGIDGASIAESDWKRFWDEQHSYSNSSNKKKLTRETLGDILSYLSVIQDAYNRGYQNVWILPDDLEIKKNPSLIDSYINTLNKNEPKWGLLFTDLDTTYKNSKGQSEPGKGLSIKGAIRENQTTKPASWYLTRKTIHKHFQEIRLRNGFHSVVVSRHGMKKILDYFKHVQIFTSFDTDIHFIPGLNKYELKNPLIVNAPKKKASGSTKNAPALENLPQPYSSLQKVLPFKTSEPFPKKSAEALGKLIDRLRPETAITSGSSLESSSCFIAKKLPEAGRLYAISKWSKGLKQQNEVYDQFLSDVIHEHLTHKIIPLRMDIYLAAQKIKQQNKTAKLIYLNTIDQESNLYRSLATVLPLLDTKGVICGNSKDERVAKCFARDYKLQFQALTAELWVVYKQSNEDLLK